MPTLKELLDQKCFLDAQIRILQRAEYNDALERARSLVSRFDLTPEDVFSEPEAPAPKKPRPKVLAKYYDPSSGNSWTGRGRMPRWIAGRDLTQFLIKR